MSISKEYKVSNVDNLNIRKGPSTNYDIITSIPKGTKVEIIPNTENWSIVNYNGTIGYVYKVYLSDIKMENEKDNDKIISIKVVNTNNLNFRKSPSTNSEILEKISKGSQVELISEENGWSKVKYNKKTGYVYNKYLSEKVTDSSSSLPNAQKIIDYAKSLLGKPYVWADEGPNSFDCSGFTWYVFKNVAQISLPRSSTQQGTYGTYINKNDLIPGDLIFFDTVGFYDRKITHVGLYIGNNQFIHASSGKGKVVISDLGISYYTKAYVLARRVLK